MELTGRTYIFAAATLVLLAGALGLYSDHIAKGGKMNLAGMKISSCQSSSVRTSNVQLGCQSDTLGSSVGSGQISLRGSAKTIRVGG
ncbi:hypothetical protein AB3Y40_18330 [Yoonia sp. R2331]|uniref:hypothetical protein n=1 Tax=Yoonia sp. R2331 TaxID=3237238 RepID=UPI0034E3DAD4